MGHIKKGPFLVARVRFQQGLFYTVHANVRRHCYCAFRLNAQQDHMVMQHERDTIHDTYERK